MTSDEYLSLAIMRGQVQCDCEECSGTGRWFDPETVSDEPCTACHGTGLESGECHCGAEFGVLVPDSADLDGATMVCPRCAVVCHHCLDEVSTHTDDDGERYCDACWELEQRRVAVIWVVAVAAPANSGLAVAR